MGVKLILVPFFSPFFSWLQSLLYGALRAAKEMILPENGGAELIRTVDARLTALSFHIRHYYWLDQKKLNEIYRYKTEEYSYEAVNKFNIYPDQVRRGVVTHSSHKSRTLVTSHSL